MQAAAETWHCLTQEIDAAVHTQTSWQVLLTDAFGATKAFLLAWTRVILPALYHLYKFASKFALDAARYAKRQWPAIQTYAQHLYASWEALDRDSKLIIIASIGVLILLWILRRQLVKHKVFARIEAKWKDFKLRLWTRYVNARKALSQRSRAAAGLLPHILYVAFVTLLVVFLPSSPESPWISHGKHSIFSSLLLFPRRIGFVTRNLLESQGFLLFVSVVLPFTRTWLAAASFGHSYAVSESKGGPPRKLPTLTVLRIALGYVASKLFKSGQIEEHVSGADAKLTIRTDDESVIATAGPESSKPQYMSEKDQINQDVFPSDFAKDEVDVWHGTNLKRGQTVIYSAAEALERKLYRLLPKGRDLRFTTSRVEQVQAMSKVFDESYESIGEEDDSDNELAGTIDANSGTSKSKNILIRTSNTRGVRSVPSFANQDIAQVWRNWQSALKRTIRDPFSAENALEAEAQAERRRRAVIDWSSYWSVCAIIWLVWRLPVSHKVLEALVRTLPNIALPAFFIWLQISATQGARLLNGTRTWFNTIESDSAATAGQEGDPADADLRASEGAASVDSSTPQASRIRALVETLLTFRIIPEWLRGALLGLVDEGAIWLLPSLAALMTPNFATRIVFQLVAAARPAYATTTSIFAAIKAERSLRSARSRLDNAREALAAEVARVLSKGYVLKIGSLLAPFQKVEDASPDPRILTKVLDKVLAASGVHDDESGQWADAIGLSRVATQLRKSLSGVLPGLFSTTAAEAAEKKDRLPVTNEEETDSKRGADAEKDEEWEKLNSLLDEAAEAEGVVDNNPGSFSPLALPLSPLTPDKSNTGKKQRHTPLFRRLTRRFSLGWASSEDASTSNSNGRPGESDSPAPLSTSTEQKQNVAIDHNAKDNPAKKRAEIAEEALHALTRVFRENSQQSRLLEDLQTAKTIYSKHLVQARGAYARAVCWLRYWVAWLLLLAAPEDWFSSWMFFAPQILLLAALWLQILGGSEEIFTVTRIYVDPILSRVALGPDDEGLHHDCLSPLGSTGFGALEDPASKELDDSGLGGFSLVDHTSPGVQISGVESSQPTSRRSSRPDLKRGGSHEGSSSSGRRASLSAKVVDILASK